MPPEFTICEMVPCLNESPSEKEGKSHSHGQSGDPADHSLNESPSEKEGKLSPLRLSAT